MSAPTPSPTLPRPTRSTGWADLAVRPLGPSRGWRPALRMALRDLRRHPGRTAAAAVMVLVPVLLASAVAVALATADVSRQEELRGAMASADALVRYDDTVSPPEQPFTTDQVTALVGTRVVEVRRGAGLPVRAGDERSVAGSLTTDLTDPLTGGIVALRAGRLPAGGTEVALSPGLAADLGVAPGDEVVVAGGDRTVTGLVVERWGRPDSPLVVGDAGSLTAEPSDPFATTWLVDGSPRSWSTATEAPGLSLLGRQDVGRDGAGDLVAPTGDMLLLVVVAVTLVVLEIALLAGPAFAVGVRQQQHVLALVAATGGDSRALRRVVLAQALVVGVSAAVAGAATGTGLAALSTALLRYRVDVALGPVEVLWPLVLLFVAIGVAASLASALVPAVTASRATVVRALARQAPARQVPWRGPLLGAALVGAGTLLLLAGTTGVADAMLSGSSAILLMGVGMVLVVPLPVALLARLTTRGPLGLRLAGRESTRAATRSVAAVAAVAGASAALVAGLSLTAAVRAEDATRYVPRSAYGVTTFYTDDAGAVADVVERALPGATVAATGDARFVAAFETSNEFWLPSAGCPTLPAPDREDPCWYSWHSEQGGWVEVVDRAVAGLRGYDLTGAQLAVLDDGGVLVADGVPATVGSTVEVGVVRQQWEAEDAVADTSPTTTASVTVPAARWTPSAADPSDDRRLPSVLLSPSAAASLEVVTTSEVLVLPPGVDGDSTPAEVRTATAPALEAAQGLAGTSETWTEVGYRDTLRVVDRVVLGAAALVLLGATFTATALALADARSDRTVLTAVGASPRTQRAAAGGTAALVAGTGALVGGLVGLVPGVLVGRAVLEPSVVSYGLGVADGPDVEQSLVALLPWGWFAVVLLGLPLLAGLVVALVARGRPDAEAARASARVG